MSCTRDNMSADNPNDGGVSPAFSRILLVVVATHEFNFRGCFDNRESLTAAARRGYLLSPYRRRCYVRPHRAIVYVQFPADRM